jgi:glycosyltransferase involved in cell wall biosynthesis
VLHTQHPWFLGILAARLAQRDGLPLVATYHTLYNHYGHYVFFLPKPAASGLLEWWLPEYHNRCDCVIVPSKATEESLRSFEVTSRIEVIPTGAPIPSIEARDARAKADARKRFGIPQDAPLLLYVGRLAVEKNIELVLEAFQLIAGDFPTARLLVVGTGPHEETCKQAAEAMEAGDRIHFSGAIPRDELDPVFATADLFVFGSSTETQGLVIAEARAVGTPSVVVNQGGASENVRHGEDGFVVPPEAGSFAEAVRTVLGSAEVRARMSESCLRNSRLYTPRAMAERVQDVYAWAIEHNKMKRETTPARPLRRRA